MDSSQKQKRHNFMVGLLALIITLLIVAGIGVLSLRPEKSYISGQAEATEYRVSGKVPGRIEMFFAEEGQTVKKGDTLALIDSPEVRAKLAQARAARAAAQAQDRKAKKGARAEQIEGAYELYQKALVGEDIMKKALETVKRKEDRRPRFERKVDRKFYRSSEKVENKANKKEAFKPKKEEKVSKQEVESPKEDTVKKADVDLSTKTVAELREMAKNKEIKGSSTMKKAELIEALSE